MATIAPNEPLPTEAIIRLLAAHGVRHQIHPSGAVMAYEESAELVRDGITPETSSYRDTSAWVAAPTTLDTMAAFLGYA